MSFQATIFALHSHYSIAIVTGTFITSTPSIKPCFASCRTGLWSDKKLGLLVNWLRVSWTWHGCSLVFAHLLKCHVVPLGPVRRRSIDTMVTRFFHLQRLMRSRTESLREADSLKHTVAKHKLTTIMIWSCLCGRQEYTCSCPCFQADAAGGGWSVLLCGHYRQQCCHCAFYFEHFVRHLKVRSVAVLVPVLPTGPLGPICLLILLRFWTLVLLARTCSVCRLCVFFVSAIAYPTVVCSLILQASELWLLRRALPLSCAQYASFRTEPSTLHYKTTSTSRMAKS